MAYINLCRHDISDVFVLHGPSFYKCLYIYFFSVNSKKIEIQEEQIVGLKSVTNLNSTITKAYCAFLFKYQTLQFSVIISPCNKFK